MSKSKICVFNLNWLQDSRFSDWLEKHESRTSANCKFCRKVIDVSNMGIAALVSHSKGMKHKQIVSGRQAESSNLFFKKVQDEPSTSSGEPKQSNLKSLVVPKSVLNAEILWTMKVVMSHFSFRSCVGLNDLFKVMFGDSQIAKSFQLSRTKCSYLLNFGIAPYFRQEIINLVKGAEFFSISFDESLNDVIQEEQMDIIIRFWDTKNNETSVRYIESRFLKRPNANNLLIELLEALKSFPNEKLIQLSMDGPNTNWEVLRLLQENRTENEAPSIINIGSCSLHVIHGAFQTGNNKTDWRIDKLLRAMWQIFHDSPARRDIFITVTGSDIFPKM